MYNPYQETVKRPPLSPGLWRLTRRPGSELRENETDVLVTKLPTSGLIIVTTPGWEFPITWQFLYNHFNIDRAVRLDRLTGQPMRREHG